MVVQAVLAKIVHIFPFQVQDVADAQGGVEPKGNQRIVSGVGAAVPVVVQKFF